MPEELIEDILAEEKPAEALATDKVENPSVDEPPVVEDLNATETKVETQTTDHIKSEESTKSEVTIEDLAKQIGWNPNYKGSDAVDATTYILKSREIQDTMKESNESLKAQLTAVQSSVDALKTHNERVYQADVKRMQAEIKTLKEEKKAAIELADVAKVDQIDEKIADLEKDIAAPPKTETKPETKTNNPVFDTWIKDNKWYLENDEMAQYAETVAQQYKGAPLDRLYKIVRQKVAEVFPEEFETKTITTTLKEGQKPIGPAGPVEKTTHGGDKPTFTKANLTPEQTAIMTQFVKQGIMTEDQYIKDIAKMQEA